MKKFTLFMLSVFLLFSCASLPKAEQDTYHKLREAFVNNDFPAMERIFTGTDKGVVQRVINTRDRQSNTLLLMVTASARVNMVEALLKNGADPNIAGKNKQTPLHIAAINQYKGVADALIKGNADKNRKDAKGKIPLDYAFEAKNSELVNILSNGIPQQTAARTGKNPSSAEIQAEFLAAIERDDVTAMRQLLATNKVDMHRDVPGAGSRRAMPILLWAIDTNRSFSIVTELIDYYTDPLDDIVDREGRNAWYYATLRHNRAVQNLLKQKGITTKDAANTQW